MLECLGNNKYSRTEKEYRYGEYLMVASRNGGSYTKGLSKKLLNIDRNGGRDKRLSKKFLLRLISLGMAGESCLNEVTE